MAFALPRGEIDKLIEELELLEKNPRDDQLRHRCLRRTHAICDVLAMGEQLEAQVTKLVDADNALRASKLMAVLAQGGAMTRRLKFSKMF
jgi:hypothetical protein